MERSEELLNLIADIRSLREENQTSEDLITKLISDLEDAKGNVAYAERQIEIKQDELDNLIAEMTGEEDQPIPAGISKSKFYW